jgi:oxygen-dependent protoporphyrinogen oxidase
MERESGSLVRATLKAKASARAMAKPGAQAQPLFTSLKNGMQQMVDALAAALPAERLRLREQHLLLRPANEDWQIEGGGTSERFQAVLLALPAPAAAATLRQVHPGLIEGLSGIQYTSSVAVALAYDDAELPPGHGFLAPRPEGRKIMACTFVHKKFFHRAPEGAKLLRCFFSSSRMPELLSYSDEDFVRMARQELKEILGEDAQPRFTRTFRWDRAMAQYETGHPERVAEMEKIIAQMPGFYMIGNSFHGIGVPDCIKSARLAVEAITSGASQPMLV